MIGFIYKIENKINNFVYIGSTIQQINKRWNEHRLCLNKNKHHCLYLQNAWNKYGEENFLFEVIETHENSELFIRNQEQMYIDKYKELNILYNTCLYAESCLEKKHTEETKKKISESHKGKKVSEETKIKISNTLKEKPLTLEQKEKMAQGRKNRTITEKHKNNLSKALKGRKFNNEWKQALSIARKTSSYQFSKEILVYREGYDEYLYFNKIKTASLYTKVSPSAISSCLKEYVSNIRGWYFVYYKQKEKI